MKHLGLVAICVYWVTVSLILYRFGVDSNKTISDHVATGRQRKIYTPLALTYYILLTTYLIIWFMPAQGAVAYQYFLLYVGMVFLLLTFLIPRHGKNIQVHDMFASVMGLSVLLVIITFLLGRLSGVWEALSVTVVVLLSVLGLTLMKRSRRGYLQTQIFFFAMLHLMLLTLTYIA